MLWEHALRSPVGLLVQAPQRGKSELKAEGGRNQTKVEGTSRQQRQYTQRSWDWPEQGGSGEDGKGSRSHISSAFAPLASTGDFGRLNYGSMSTVQVLQGKGRHAWAGEMGWDMPGRSAQGLHSRASSCPEGLLV